MAPPVRPSIVGGTARAAAGTPRRTAGGARLVGAAGRGVIGEQALERIERRVERRSRRALDPVAVPAAVGQSVFEEPVDDAGDVGAEPHAVGDRPGVDAAVDLAAPVRQVLVLPAAVLGEKLSRAALAQDSGVEAPLPQRVQRPGRRRPRLTGTFVTPRDRRSRSPQGRTRRRPTGRPGPAARGGARRSLRSPILARVASQTSAGSPTRSRSTCQRNAGSESSSQAIWDPVTMARP